MYLHGVAVKLVQLTYERAKVKLACALSASEKEENEVKARGMSDLLPLYHSVAEDEAFFVDDVGIALIPLDNRDKRTAVLTGSPHSQQLL